MRRCFRLPASIVGAVSVLLAGGGDLLAQAGGGRPLAPSIAPAGIEFSVGQESYRLGDTITFVLANESDRYAETNLCAITMERWGAEGFERVSRHPPNPFPLACPDMAIALPPSRSFVTPTPVIREMEAGVYRFRGYLYLGGVQTGTRTTLITNEFRVVR